MSLESFFGLDDADSQGSAEAAEKFREQMRASRQAAANMQAHSQMQHSQEEAMARLLVKFLKDPSKSDLVFIVVKLLGENVPGAFILGVISISDLDLMQKLRQILAPLLKALKPEDLSHKEMNPFNSASSLPENIRSELNVWGQVILETGLMRPGKTLSTVLTPNMKLKSLVIDLLEYVLDDYFIARGIEISEEDLRQFSLLAIQTVLLELRNVTQEKSDMDIIESPLENLEVQSPNAQS